MGVHFLTFANKEYASLDQIRKEASEFEIFDEISLFNEDNISDFVEEHKEFISSHRQGYGLYIWKPKIIYDKLLSMKENDILFYCDIGTHMNVKGKKRFLEYIEMLSDKTPLVAFGSSERYIIQYYAFLDAAMEYYPQIFEEPKHVSCYAGVILLKKTSATVNFISDWLKLCTNYNYLTGTLSGKYQHVCHSDGADADNGLFGICLLKYKIHKLIYPDECSLYNGDKQLIHEGIHPEDMPWDLLEDFPLHVRRYKKM